MDSIFPRQAFAAHGNHTFYFFVFNFSYLCTFSTREIFYLIAHDGLEFLILLCSCAMHGVERAIIVVHKLMCKGGDESIVYWSLGKMQSGKGMGWSLANDLLCLAHDVYYSLMRTSGKEYRIAVFLY